MPAVVVCFLGLAGLCLFISSQPDLNGIHDSACINDRGLELEVKCPEKLVCWNTHSPGGGAVLRGCEIIEMCDLASLSGILGEGWGRPRR